MTTKSNSIQDKTKAIMRAWFDDMEVGDVERHEARIAQALQEERTAGFEEYREKHAKWCPGLHVAVQDARERALEEAAKAVEGVERDLWRGITEGDGIPKGPLIPEAIARIRALKGRQ